MRKIYVMLLVSFLLGGTLTPRSGLIFSEECDTYSTSVPVPKTGIKIPVRVEECVEIVPCPQREEDKSDCRVWDAISGEWREVYGKKKTFKVIPEENVIVGVPDVKYYIETTVIRLEKVSRKVEKEVKYVQQKIDESITIKKEVGKWKIKEDRKK